MVESLRCWKSAGGEATGEEDTHAWDWSRDTHMEEKASDAGYMAIGKLTQRAGEPAQEVSK